MQIVPYMPIHPAQLNNDNNSTTTPTIVEKPPEKEEKSKTENDDHLFKKPFLPTPYIVEEPVESIARRTPRMKRFDDSETSSYNK